MGWQWRSQEFFWRGLKNSGQGSPLGLGAKRPPDRGPCTKYRTILPVWGGLSLLSPPLATPLRGPCGAGVRTRASQVVGCGFRTCLAVWVFLPGAPIKPNPTWWPQVVRIPGLKPPFPSRPRVEPSSGHIRHVERKYI